MTPNFADTHHQLMVDLHEGPGSGVAAQHAKRLRGEVPAQEDTGPVPMMQREEPRLPTLERMHQIGAENPRAQAKFFLLQTELWCRFCVGIDELSVGRISLASRSRKSREDDCACSLQPGLVRGASCIFAPFEAQGRGFQHRHSKIHSVSTGGHTRRLLDSYAIPSHESFALE